MTPSCRMQPLTTPVSCPSCPFSHLSSIWLGPGPTPSQSPLDNCYMKLLSAFCISLHLGAARRVVCDQAPQTCQNKDNLLTHFGDCLWSVRNRLSHCVSKGHVLQEADELHHPGKRFVTSIACGCNGLAEKDTRKTLIYIFDSPSQQQPSLTCFLFLVTWPLSNTPNQQAPSFMHRTMSTHWCIMWANAFCETDFI